MEKYRRKVGLVMGSFDPIHIGHLDLIRQALDAGMDEILVVPSPQNPWKNNHGASFVERCEMAKIACSDMFPGKTVMIEPGDNPEEIDKFLDSDGKSYSYIQLPMIIDKHGENDYYIIGGTDLGESVKKWKNWDTHLKDFFNLLIIERPGFSDITSELQIKVSSTAIREMLKEKRDVRPYVLRSVLYYINKNHLYE